MSANNFDAAKRLRHDQTRSESLLWARLRNRQLDSWKFRRQHPIGRYVLDFYCAEALLAVEIDGAVHNEDRRRSVDAERQRLLEERGVRFLRVSAESVESDLETVLVLIADTLREAAGESRVLSPSPRERGEGAGG